MEEYRKLMEWVAMLDGMSKEANEFSGESMNVETPPKYTKLMNSLETAAKDAFGVSRDLVYSEDSDDNS